uniref:Truncated major surface protein n=1 Tax=Hepatitis B virus TaxID=10407 RepID=Q8B461_HBV|nr:truncated major surface protein [Hepatitis B virus]
MLSIFLFPILWDSFPITSWTLRSEPTHTIPIGTSTPTRIIGQRQIR